MKNKQHTPGTWIKLLGNKGGNDHVHLDVKDWQNDGFEIARFRGPDRLANATLCAAAPELLEALESILERILENPSDHKNLESVILKAISAIAKATGKA
jgi:hypothetical protein